MKRNYKLEIVEYCLTRIAKKIDPEDVTGCCQLSASLVIGFVDTEFHKATKARTQFKKDLAKLATMNNGYWFRGNDERVHALRYLKKLYSHSWWKFGSKPKFKPYSREMLVKHCIESLEKHKKHSDEYHTENYHRAQYGACTMVWSFCLNFSTNYNSSNTHQINSAFLKDLEHYRTTPKGNSYFFHNNEERLQALRYLAMDYERTRGNVRMLHSNPVYTYD